MSRPEQKAERVPFLRQWGTHNVRVLTGRRFGRLKVTAPTDGRGANGAVVWSCDCRCGTNGVLVLGTNLTSGNTASCGCVQVERSKRANRKGGVRWRAK